MINNIVMKEVVIKALEKKTFIKFSENSLITINKALDDYMEGMPIETINKQFSHQRTTQKIISQAIDIYKEEINKD